MRAFSTTDSPCGVDSVRKMRFQVAGGFSAQYRAAIVWSAERVVLAADPSDFTSSNSRAYARLVSDSGPLERNCDALRIRNGFTSFSQAFGSLTKAGRTGCQAPAPNPTRNRNGPNRPSSVRAAIIAAAAA